MTIVRWILAVLVFLLVGMAAMKSLRPRPMPPTTVQTAKAQRTTVTRTVSGNGKLEPLRKVNVSAQITGTLLDLKVGIGSEVKKGQYLGQIDTSRYQTQVQQQRAQASASASDVQRERTNLTRMRADADRLAALVERGAANFDELEQARTAVRVAEANLSSSLSRQEMARASVSEAEKAVQWATLTAPVDGTVLSVNHRVGERLRGSDFSEDVILVLGTLAEMDVRIEVGEHDVVFIKPRQKASIEIDAIPDVPMKGEVIDSGRDAIVKNAGTENEVTTYPVWVSLENPHPKAMSGMSAQVVISAETRENVVAVPIQAVTMRAAPGKEGETKKTEKVVFVLKDGKVEKRKVTTGLSSDTHIEVSDGLAEGEEVVEGPYRVLARELEDGAKVEVGPPGMGPGGPRGPGRGPRG